MLECSRQDTGAVPQARLQVSLLMNVQRTREINLRREVRKLFLGKFEPVVLAVQSVVVYGSLATGDELSEHHFTHSAIGSEFLEGSRYRLLHDESMIPDVDAATGTSTKISNEGVDNGPQDQVAQ